MSRQSSLNNTKWLFVGVIVLLLVVVGEGAYYVYRQGFSLCPSRKTEKAGTLEEAQCFTLQKDYRAPLNINLLESMKYFNESALRSSKIVNQYSGTIVELAQESGTIQYEYYKNPQKPTYPYQLKMVLESDGAKRTFYFTKALLESANILKIVDENVENLTINDLIVGDMVEIHQTYDLMRPGCIEHECVSAIQVVKR